MRTNLKKWSRAVEYSSFFYSTTTSTIMIPIYCTSMLALLTKFILMLLYFPAFVVWLEHRHRILKTSYIMIRAHTLHVFCSQPNIWCSYSHLLIPSFSNAMIFHSVPFRSISNLFVFFRYSCNCSYQSHPEVQECPPRTYSAPYQTPPDQAHSK